MDNGQTVPPAAALSTGPSRFIPQFLAEEAVRFGSGVVAILQGLEGGMDMRLMRWGGGCRVCVHMRAVDVGVTATARGDVHLPVLQHIRADGLMSAFLCRPPRETAPMEHVPLMSFLVVFLLHLSL